MSTLARVKQELKGTVYNGADTVRVFIAGHPLRLEKIEILILAGFSIEEIVAQASVETYIYDLATTVVCYIDGHPVPRENWRKVRPKAGTTILLRAVAEGPLVGAIAPIFTALSAAAASVSTFLGGLGILGKVIGLGLTIGAQFLLNALFPARQPQLSQEPQEQGKQAFNISGSRNTAAPYQSIPIVLGEHRVTPFYGAQPYTESFGDDQYWRGLFVWTYGPARLRDLKIGETPLNGFQDLQIEYSYNYAPGAALPLYPGSVIEEPLSIDLTYDLGWVSRVTATNITEISLDIVWPSGLYAVTLSDGKKHQFTVQMKAQYRNVNSATWVDFPPLYVTARSVDALRRTMRVVVPAGQYEVRVARVTLDDEVLGNDDWHLFTKTALTAIRGTRPGQPITFPQNLVTSAVRIRANQQLNGGLDQLNGIVQGFVLNAFNGSIWTGANTSRNPADLVRYVLQGPANARPVPDSQIDLASLEAWWRYCNAQGFNYDAVITSPRSVPDMVGEICSAGRAVPLWKDGKWSVVWDAIDPPVVQAFTPRNSWGFESKREYMVMPHGFKVRFINREKGFIEDERIVYADGYGPQNATLFEALEFPGVTDPHNIWRHARFHLAQLQLRPETITINTDWENLVCTRGDRVRLQHDVMLIGQVSGRILGYENGQLLLDETVTVEAGRNYTLRWRAHDMSLYTTDFRGMAAGEYTSLPWSGSRPDDGVLFMWGELAKETAVYRVLSIEPNADLTARITLVDDAPAISAADQGAIPPFQSNVTPPVNPFVLPPFDLRSTQEIYQDGEEWLASIRFDWQARTSFIAAFEVSWADLGDNPLRWRTTRVPASQLYFVINGLSEGSYRFRVRTMFTDNTWSNWLQSGDISTTALFDPPGDVRSFNVAVIGDMSTLSWQSVSEAAYYEIRFASGDDEATWNSATPLVPRVSGVSAQVPTMVGTYFIKAVRGNGIRSRNATSIQTNIAGLTGLNVVEVLTEAGWPGVKDRVEVINGNLRLLSQNVIGNWSSLSAVANLAAGQDGAGANVNSVGYYTFAQTVDLTGVYTSRLTAATNAEGADLTNVVANWSSLAAVPMLDNSQPEDWGVELQYRTTDSAPSAGGWSEWRPFIVGDVTARAFQFRLRLNGKAEVGNSFSNITPIVHGLSVSIDMPDRVDAGNDITVPTAGRRVSFSPAFVALRGLAISAQDMATGERYAITNKDETGFNIRFFNSSNTAVSRTFDYVAKGYGNLITA